jgi:hypothetical protein
VAIFEEWCDFDREGEERKRLWKLTEKAGGRAAIRDELCETLRHHYRAAERMADDIESLGFPGAAAIIAELLPRTATARSGDLGEVLATELVEEEIGFRVPVRRLRYKDSREMALRGDDFIGARLDGEARLHLLKGESKSRLALAANVVVEAREALTRDDGRPTPSSLLFVSDRLLDGEAEDQVLGRALRDEIANRAVPAARIDHVLFTLSGNAPPQALTDDLNAADGVRTHTVVNCRITDHQAFIADVFEGAGDLGDD